MDGHPSPQGEGPGMRLINCVLKMHNLWYNTGLYRNDVESDMSVPVGSIDVFFGGFKNSPCLLTVYKLLGMAIVGISPGLHFYKNCPVFLSGDDINFTVSVTVVPDKYLEAFSF